MTPDFNGGGVRIFRIATRVTDWQPKWAIDDGEGWPVTTGAPNRSTIKTFNTLDEAVQWARDHKAGYVELPPRGI